jgi:hypothetical protein
VRACPCSVENEIAGKLKNLERLNCEAIKSTGAKEH